MIELPIDQESQEEINDNNCLKDGLEIKDHLISDIDKEKNRMKKKLIVHFESHSSWYAYNSMTSKIIDDNKIIIVLLHFISQNPLGSNDKYTHSDSLHHYVRPHWKIGSDRI